MTQTLHTTTHCRITSCYIVIEGKMVIESVTYEPFLVHVNDPRLHDFMS